MKKMPEISEKNQDFLGKKENIKLRPKQLKLKSMERIKEGGKIAS